MKIDQAVKYIILAEPDEDDVFFFSLAIEQIGPRVSLARTQTGQELTQLLSERIPDILFLSLQLECDDHQRCLTAIRNDPGFDHMPIVIYSSFEDPEDIEFAFRKCSNLFLVKPNTLKDLVMILEQVIDFNWTETMYFPSFSKFVIRSD